MREALIKSKTFTLYEAFKKEAEMLGYKYVHEFTPFEHSKAECFDGLFFISDWGGYGCNGIPGFSFSNSNRNIFTIPEQWDDAISAIKEILESNKIVTREEIANWKGCSVKDLIIK
jgi:hypothetical protein